MPIDAAGAATSLSGAANTVVSGATSVASGATSLVSNPSSLLGAAQSGLSNLATSVNEAVAGAASKVTGAISAVDLALKNTFNFSAGDILKSASKAPFKAKLPMSNILHNYASYNYIFTLSVLDDVGYNFPDDSYRKQNGDRGLIICKSGSGDPDNRVQIDLGPELGKGKMDFYIDDVRITGTMGLDRTTGNTNATNISFKIIEPYSMGLFFQSLQTGALKQKHDNYVDAPYLLTLEFKGHVSNVVQGVVLEPARTTKHFPIKISTIEMNVTNKGAVYSVEAFPYNESAHSTTYSELKKDTAIKGITVHEALQTGEQSLQKVVNDQLKETAKKAETDPDQVLIYFPKDRATSSSSAPAGESTDAATTSSSSGTTVETKLKVSKGQNTTLVQNTADINDIGRQSMGFDSFAGGQPVFAKDNGVWDKDKKIFTRDNIAIDPTQRMMNFSQGGDIVDAINQVILTSEFGQKSLQDSQITSTGKVAWWRIDTQVYNLEPNKNKTKKGTKPKLIVYRVLPYMVDAALFMPPNASNPTSVELAKTVVKEYNYIYTGKNLDVISFDMNFKAGFYQSLNADAGKNTEATQTASQTGSTNEKKDTEASRPADGAPPNTSNPPSNRQYDNTKTQGYTHGGAPDTPESIAARQAHMAFTTPCDMVAVSLKILGDPYYIGDSGVGNYSAKASTNENITADDGIDYQTGDTFIKVNFRTPVGFSSKTGGYVFADTKLIRQFSGLYRVLNCESTFSRGRFEQTLQLNRQPNQVSEGDTATGTAKMSTQAKEVEVGTEQSASEKAVAADINKAGI